MLSSVTGGAVGASAAAVAAVQAVDDRVTLAPADQVAVAGTVTRKATVRDRTRLAQNSTLVRPAFIAPGTVTTIALSMISMTAMEIVSAAKATGSAAVSA
jgi:hypothetical protein